MKTILQITTASAVAFCAFAFTATPSLADTRSPAIIQRGHYCLSYNGGGFVFSFTSYAHCQATASCQFAACFGNSPADHTNPWKARARPSPRPHFLLTIAGHRSQ